MDSQEDNSKLKPLSFLIGSWRTDGEVLKTSKSQKIKIKGTDSYEWVLGGSFILHRVNVMMGEVKTEVMELIGEYDEVNNTYQMRAFDNTGAFSTMQASVNSEGTLLITGDKMQSKLTVANDGKSMNARWEISEDGKIWMPWMHLTLAKF